MQDPFLDGPPRPLTFGERTVHSLLFFFFAAVGLLGTLAILWGIWQKSAVYRWTPAECVVVASSVERHPEAPKDTEEFRFVVSYAYAFSNRRGNQPHTNTRPGTAAPTWRWPGASPSATRPARTFPAG